jgi:CRP-like cAMP-binding protein
MNNNEITNTTLSEALKRGVNVSASRTMQSTHGTSENEEAYRFLQSLKEFSLLPPSDLKALANSAHFANLDPGQYITTEGDEESLYGFIVVTGHLAMLKTSVNGKELIVELLQAGDIFGLLLMLAAEKLPAQLSARSLKKSRVLWLPLSSFVHMLKKQPQLFKEFVAHLLICLQSSYQLSRGLAHDRVEVRIAAILSSLSIKFAKPKSFEVSSPINVTRQQLADLTGTTSETAIRVTRAMQRNSIIDIKTPGMIRIINLKALNEIAES